MGNQPSINAHTDRNTIDSDIELDDDDLLSLVDELFIEIGEDFHQHDHKNYPDFVTHISSINKLYSYRMQIGRGVSGGVFLVQSLQTHKPYALKEMMISDMNYKSFTNEINILKQLNHPNIIHLNAAHISKEHCFLTEEYCSGGSLYQRIRTKKRFSERNAIHFVKEIVEAIHHIHAKDIVHRDLKLSNLVLDRHSKLKLIDFGESEIITDYDKEDRNVVGTLNYLAPETARTRKKCELFASDMWAVGIMSYRLTQGAFPFMGHDVPSLLQNINDTELVWNCKMEVSASCKDFIESLLDTDVTNRLTAKEALQHGWIVNQVHGDNLYDITRHC